MGHTLSTLLAVFWLAAATWGNGLPPEGTRGLPDPIAAGELPSLVAGGDPEPQVVAESEPAPVAPPEPTPPPTPTPAEPKADPEAVSACLDRSIDRIQARYEDVRDVEAGFVQTTRPAHLANTSAEPSVSAGRMVVAKPGKMRWTYETPEQSLVVSDGESLWIYDAAFGEAQKLPVTDGFLSGAATQFLLGEGDMRRDFEIALESCDAKRVVLQLTPKQPASYAQLQLVADPTSGNLTETRVDDLLGNSTTIIFENLRVNLGPDAKMFRFDAPEGVDVIEIEAP
jgi:outer membrane lipoprotein carrier protein